MFRESLKMSWQNIVHNKMRSFLTILGIVIGVAAIIALITTVQSVITEVNSQFDDLAYARRLRCTCRAAACSARGWRGG